MTDYLEKHDAKSQDRWKVWEQPPLELAQDILADALSIMFPRF